MRSTKSRGMRSSTRASVASALYATTRMPIRFWSFTSLTPARGLVAQLLAEHELLDLPRRRARELVDLANLLGPLLTCQPGVLHRVLDFEERGCRRPRQRPYERAAVLAEPLVVRSHERDLGHPGYVQQHLFDLRRADVAAAADDDVALAVDDRQVAVGIQHADVAGRVPVVLPEDLLRELGVRVAEEALGPATPDLARPTGRDVAPVVVDEPDLVAFHRPAVGVDALLRRLVPTRAG